MPKEELTKLAEILAAVGYKIMSLDWTDVGPFTFPYGEVINLKIVKPWPKK